MKPTLIVLAAGMGSRYGRLKQLDPFGPAGETLIEYSVYDAIRAGFGKVVFVIRKSLEATFAEEIFAKLAGHIRVEYVFQELEYLPEGFSVPAGRVKPWGTGQAVLLAGAEVNEPFAVINGDDFYGAESFRGLAAFLAGTDPAAADYAVVGYPLRNTLSDFGTVARAVCEVDAGGWLRGMRELTSIGRTAAGIGYRDAGGAEVPLTGEETVSMNMMGFTPSLFAHCRVHFEAFLREQGNDPKAEFYLPLLVNGLVREGKARVKVLPTTATWFGVTYLEDRPLVVEKIAALTASGAYPPRLWK
ncbi:MAG: Glutamate synthase [NADPH] large chain [uncultured Cytophagales bacterium]|uniref:Glutamate synthase [NADPH] large chain n=1 Tax=uncultured Cytophagales bacterium TaxID=158755 RepID=A0A6J4JDT1_9SPHI|nr:MAG: Glutamate synthase [NADPH] large chain [uncultured Cytophagales bacterium]